MSNFQSIADQIGATVAGVDASTLLTVAAVVLLALAVWHRFFRKRQVVRRLVQDETIPVRILEPEPVDLVGLHLAFEEQVKTRKRRREVEDILWERLNPPAPK